MKKLSFFLIPALAILLSACSGLTEKINPNWAVAPNSPTVASGTVTSSDPGTCDLAFTGTLFLDESTGSCGALVLIDGETPVKYRAFVDDVTMSQLGAPMEIAFDYIAADPALDEGIHPDCLAIDAIVITCMEDLND